MRALPRRQAETSRSAPLAMRRGHRQPALRAQPTDDIWLHGNASFEGIKNTITTAPAASCGLGALINEDRARLAAAWVRAQARVRPNPSAMTRRVRRGSMSRAAGGQCHSRLRGFARDSIRVVSVAVICRRSSLRRRHDRVLCRGRSDDLATITGPSRVHPAAGIRSASYVLASARFVLSVTAI